MAAGCSVFLGPVPRPLHLGEGVGAGLLRPGQPPQPLSQRPRHLPLAQVTPFCLCLSLLERLTFYLQIFLSA